MGEFEALQARIVACERCPRLRNWCQRVSREKRRSYQDHSYWGKPVPNFGDPDAELLIVGLAPAAHGANRTGRMFTGDRSGDWLYRALHRAGLASSPHSSSIDDGLQLYGVLITAVAHCAPPANKPEVNELAACRSHLLDTIGLRPWRGILCLGNISWQHTLRALGLRRVPFAHGAEVDSLGEVTVIGSYHPSQQNTFTGRLTEAMLDDVVGRLASRRSLQASDAPAHIG